jgi:hypothetical protein
VGSTSPHPRVAAARRQRLRINPPTACHPRASRRPAPPLLRPHRRVLTFHAVSSSALFASATSPSLSFDCPPLPRSAVPLLQPSRSLPHHHHPSPSAINLGAAQAPCSNPQIWPNNRKLFHLMQVGPMFCQQGEASAGAQDTEPGATCATSRR